MVGADRKNSKFQRNSLSFNFILSNWHVKYFEGDNESSLKDDHYEISVQNESNSQNYENSENTKTLVTVDRNFLAVDNGSFTHRNENRKDFKLIN